MKKLIPIPVVLFLVILLLIVSSSITFAQNQYQIAPRWSRVNSPTAVTLRGVSMVSSSDGWAVGEQGTILHWDGTEWSPMVSPTSADLYAIDMVTTDDGWAVGIDGVILHWDGSAWSLESSPVVYYLVDVELITSTDGWIVGHGGTILHWDGTSWTEVSAPYVPHLRAVDLVSSSDVWAAGHDVQGNMLHWDGLEWSTSTIPSWMGQLSTVSMVSSTDGWAGGGTDGTLIHWDGSSWSAEPLMPGIVIHDIDIVSSTDGWAVGRDLVHWNGSTWDRVNDSSIFMLYDVEMVSSVEGWAVGRDGAIFYYGENYVGLRQAGDIQVSGDLTQGSKVTFSVPVENSGTLPSLPIHPVVAGSSPEGYGWWAENTQPTARNIEPGETVIFEIELDLLFSTGTWTTNSIYLWNDLANLELGQLEANGFNQQINFDVSPPPTVNLRQAGDIQISGNLIEGENVFFTIPIQNIGDSPSQSIHPLVQGYLPDGGFWQSDLSHPTAQVIQPGETVFFELEQNLWLGQSGTWTISGVFIWDDDTDTIISPLDNNGFVQYSSFNVDPLYFELVQAEEIQVGGDLVEGSIVYLTIPITNIGNAPSPPIHPYTEGYTSKSELWRADNAQPTAIVIEPGETINFQVEHELWVGHTGDWRIYGVFLWDDSTDSYYGQLPANGHNQNMSFTVNYAFYTLRQAGEIQTSGDFTEGSIIYLTIPITNTGTIPSDPIHPYVEGVTPIQDFWQTEIVQPIAKIIDPGEVVIFQIEQELWDGYAGEWIIQQVQIWDDSSDSYLRRLDPNGFLQAVSFDVLPSQPSNFVRHSIFPDLIAPHDAFPSDLDADGDMDVVFIGVLKEDSSYYEVGWLENIGNQTFRKWTIDAGRTLNWPHLLSANDIDNDGDMDLIWVLRYSGEIAWWKNDGNENFSKQLISNTFDGNITSAISYDVDSDGDVDIITSRWCRDPYTCGSFERIELWVNDGAQSFTLHFLNNRPVQPRITSVEDLDDDGDIDILAVSDGSRSFGWLENDGNEYYTPHLFYDDLVIRSGPFAEDIDGDGDFDFLGSVRDPQSGSPHDSVDYIAWWQNDGDGEFRIHFLSTTSVVLISPADIDLDGDMDFFGANPDSGRIFWFKNEGNANFIQYGFEYFFKSVDNLHPIDFDSDGDQDLLGVTNWSSYPQIAWWEQVGSPNPPTPSAVIEGTINVTDAPASDQSLPEVVVTLMQNGVEIDRTLTDNTGHYRFPSEAYLGNNGPLTGGQYHLRIIFRHDRVEPDGTTQPVLQLWWGQCDVASKIDDFCYASPVYATTTEPNVALSGEVTKHDIVIGITSLTRSPASVKGVVFTQEYLVETANIYMHSMEVIQYARDVLKVPYTLNLPIDVHAFAVPSGSGSYYIWQDEVTSYGSVYLEGYDPSSPQVGHHQNNEWHELFHELMDETIGAPAEEKRNSPPDNYDFQHNHGGLCNPTTADSWFEAWPVFWSVQLADYIGDHSCGPNQYCVGEGHIDIERNYTPRSDFDTFASTAAWPADPYAEELAIAGILHDLVDPWKDDDGFYGDYVEMNLIDEFWPNLMKAYSWAKAQYGHTFQNMYEVYTALDQLNQPKLSYEPKPGEPNALDRIFLNHGFIDGFSPVTQDIPPSENICDELFDRTIPPTEDTTILQNLLRRNYRVLDNALLHMEVIDEGGTPSTEGAIQVSIQDLQGVYDAIVYKVDISQLDEGELFIYPPQARIPSLITLTAFSSTGNQTDSFVIDNQLFWDRFWDPDVGFILDHTFEIGASGKVNRAISVDIKPDDYPNHVNCNNLNGVITVGVLSTASFDATTIDHSTVEFAGASETHVNKKTGEPQRHEEDVDGDGDLDLVFHFRFRDTDLNCGSTSAVLSGLTFDGISIQGTDTLEMKHPNIPKKP